jgi:integrase
MNLNSRLPLPTTDNPHAQLDWIFKDKSLLYSNQGSQENYLSALAFYKRFLSHTHNYSAQLEKDPRFFLAREWDVFALHKVKTWLDATNIAGEDGYLSSYTVLGTMSSLRQTMAHAYEHSYIKKPVINVSMPGAVRETSSHTAYSLDEYEQIFRVLTPLIKLSRDLVKPYVPTGKGTDPSKLRRAGLKRGDRLLGQGWNCWGEGADHSIVRQEDNLRWYFENVMRCVPLSASPRNIKHLQFFLTAARLSGGLKQLYYSWGVSYSIDGDVILPLVVELASETGLNVESVLSLKRDCFKEAHPLTGLPFMEYTKPRSGGQKELHTSLYNDRSQDVIGLKQRQSRIISNSIRTILELTEPLVSRAHKEDGEYLFLFEPRPGKSTRSVQRLNLSAVTHWTNKMIKQHDLRADSGKQLSFNLSRFRPTKITELVTQGYDFFDIMAIAGHSSIITTLSYIDRLKSAGDFHCKIEKALTMIKKNKEEYDRHPLLVAITRRASPSKFIFKAPICHCKNPYDPPEVVRKSDNYHEGDACSNFNMCLTCDNVLVTEMNLPKLVAYRSETIGR